MDKDIVFMTYEWAIKQEFEGKNKQRWGISFHLLNVLANAKEKK